MFPIVESPEQTGAFPLARRLPEPLPIIILLHILESERHAPNPATTIAGLPTEINTILYRVAHSIPRR